MKVTVRNLPNRALVRLGPNSPPLFIRVILHIPIPHPDDDNDVDEFIVCESPLRYHNGLYKGLLHCGEAILIHNQPHYPSNDSSEQQRPQEVHIHTVHQPSTDNKEHRDSLPTAGVEREREGVAEGLVLQPCVEGLGFRLNIIQV